MISEDEKKKLEKIIGDIWWRLNKVEWLNNGVVVTAEDQAGHPFECFRFELSLDCWPEALEAALLIELEYIKRPFSWREKRDK